VITEVGIGLVHRPHVLDDLDHVIPVEHLLRGVDDSRDRVETCAMRSSLTHRDVPFAVLTELGPVLGDRCVEVDGATVHHQVKQSGHHPLARGHAQRQRLGFEWGSLSVPRSACEIRDELAPMIHRDGGAAGSARGHAPAHGVPQ
jgi:hypothetical protein